MAMSSNRLDKTIARMRELGFKMVIRSATTGRGLLMAHFFSPALGVNSGWQRGDTLDEVIFKASEKAQDAAKRHVANAAKFPSET